MKKARLYQYAVIWNPSDKQLEDGEKAKLVIGVTTSLGYDEASIGLKAAKEIPDEFNEELDQIEITVKLF